MTNSSESLCETSLLPVYVVNPSYINSASDQMGGVRQGSYILYTRGDVIIQGLWELQTDAIINIGDANNYTYNNELMDDLLAH